MFGVPSCSFLSLHRICTATVLRVFGYIERTALMLLWFSLSNDEYVLMVLLALSIWMNRLLLYAGWTVCQSRGNSISLQLVVPKPGTQVSKLRKRRWNWMAFWGRIVGRTIWQHSGPSSWCLPTCRSGIPMRKRWLIYHWCWIRRCT